MKLLIFILATLDVSALSFEEWMVSHPADLVSFAVETGPTLLYREDDPRRSRLQYTLRPETSGVRVTHEVSDDLVTWSAVLTRMDRGYMRLRVEHNAQFSRWTEAVLGRTGEMALLTPQGALNPACWGADIDLSACCLDSHNGVLISPRHVLFTTHYLPAVGTSLRWITHAGTLVERTLTGLLSLPTTDYFYPDITVGLLNADAAGVPPSAILSNAAPDMSGYKVTAALVNRNRELSVADVLVVGGSPLRVQMAIPSRTSCMDRFQFMVSGDSGSPVFVIHDSGVLLMSLITVGGPGQGTYLPAYIDAINAAMLQLGGNYQLILAP